METVGESAAYVSERPAPAQVSPVGVEAGPARPASGLSPVVAAAADEGAKHSRSDTQEIAAAATRGGSSPDELGMDCPPEQRPRVQEENSILGAHGTVEPRWWLGSADVIQQVMECWGGKDFGLFVDCVRTNWQETNETDKQFPITITILLSSRRLATAIEAGWGQRGCMLAAETGNVRIFRLWTSRFGCTVEGGLLESAVRGNNTTIVEEVLEHYWARGFPMDKDAYSLAVASRSADMVDIVGGYVHCDEGVTFDGLNEAAAVGALEMVKSLWDLILYPDSHKSMKMMCLTVEIAAEHRQKEVVGWCVRTLHRQTDLPGRCVEAVMQNVCMFGPLAQWLKTEGCFDRWGDYLILMGAKDGSVEWIRWCLENGWDYDDAIMEVAAEGGHLRVVKWLRKRGYRWTGDICARAAESGDLELLKWCHSNGCPWSWPEVVKAGKSLGGFQQKGWDVYDWCVDVGGGEVLVDGKWVPMVVANTIS